MGVLCVDSTTYIVELVLSVILLHILLRTEAIVEHL